MIYTGVLSAVVSALAAECIDNTAEEAVAYAERHGMTHFIAAPAPPP